MSQHSLSEAWIAPEPPEPPPPKPPHGSSAGAARGLAAAAQAAQAAASAAAASAPSDAPSDAPSGATAADPTRLGIARLDPASEEGGPARPFPCPNCERTFESVLSLSGHKRHCKPGRLLRGGGLPLSGAHPAEGAATAPLLCGALVGLGAASAGPAHASWARPCTRDAAGARLGRPEREQEACIGPPRRTRDAPRSLIHSRRPAPAHTRDAPRSRIHSRRPAPSHTRDAPRPAPAGPA